MRVSSPLSAMIPDERAAAVLDERQVLGVGGALDAAAGRVVAHLLRQQPDEAADRAVVPVHRRVERQHAAAEEPLADRDGLVEVGALLLSSFVTTTARGMPTAAHSSQSSWVAPSTPSVAEMTNRAASAARRPRAGRRRSRRNPGCRRVDLDAVDLEGARPDPRERCWRTSASSKSETVVPVLDAAGAPGHRRPRAACSTRVVFPEPEADQHDVADLVRPVDLRMPAGGSCGVLVCHLDRLRVVAAWVVGHPFSCVPREATASGNRYAVTLITAMLNNASGPCRRGSRHRPGRPWPAPPARLARRRHDSSAVGASAAAVVLPRQQWAVVPGDPAVRLQRPARRHDGPDVGAVRAPGRVPRLHPRPRRRRRDVRRIVLGFTNSATVDGGCGDRVPRRRLSCRTPRRAESVGAECNVGHRSGRAADHRRCRGALLYGLACPTSSRWCCGFSRRSPGSPSASGCCTCAPARLRTTTPEAAASTTSASLDRVRLRAGRSEAHARRRRTATFDRIADTLWSRHGRTVLRLESNLRRVVGPEVSDDELRCPEAGHAVAASATGATPSGCPARAVSDRVVVRRLRRRPRSRRDALAGGQASSWPCRTWATGTTPARGRRSRTSGGPASPSGSSPRTSTRSSCLPALAGDGHHPAHRRRPAVPLPDGAAQGGRLRRSARRPRPGQGRRARPVLRREGEDARRSRGPRRRHGRRADDRRATSTTGATPCGSTRRSRCRRRAKRSRRIFRRRAWSSTGSPVGIAGAPDRLAHAAARVGGTSTTSTRRRRRSSEGRHRLPHDWSTPGGVQAHVRDLAVALMRLGHEVSVPAPCDDDADVEPAAVRRVVGPAGLRGLTTARRPRCSSAP